MYHLDDFGNTRDSEQILNNNIDEFLFDYKEEEVEEDKALPFPFTSISVGISACSDRL